MYLYFDKNGNLKEVVTIRKFRKGDYKSDKIYVYIEDEPVIDNIWGLVKCPREDYEGIERSFLDDTIETSIPYDKERDLKFFQDFKKYKFYKFTLSPEETQCSGLCLFTVRLTIKNEIFSQALVTFNIEDSSIKHDTYITQSQYDYIISKIGSKSLGTSAYMDITTERKLEQRIVYIDGELKTVVGNSIILCSDNNRTKTSEINLNEEGLEIKNIEKVMVNSNTFEAKGNLKVDGSLENELYVGAKVSENKLIKNSELETKAEEIRKYVNTVASGKSSNYVVSKNENQVLNFITILTETIRLPIETSLKWYGKEDLFTIGDLLLGDNVYIFERDVPDYFIAYKDDENVILASLEIKLDLSSLATIDFVNEKVGDINEELETVLNGNVPQSNFDEKVTNIVNSKIQEYNEQNNEKYSNENVVEYGDYIVSKKKKIWEGDIDIGRADRSSSVTIATLAIPILGKKIQIDTYEEQNNQSGLGKTYIFNIPNEAGEFKHIERNNAIISFSNNEITYGINEMELTITATNESFSLKGFSTWHTINTATSESFNDGFGVHITRIYEIVE